ncbi:MAG: hypothetical protein U1A77_07050 [Pirellulales bacterium]
MCRTHRISGGFLTAAPITITDLCNPWDVMLTPPSYVTALVLDRTHYLPPEP